MKKYYRVTELNELFGLSISDLEYLNAETEVSFCLYCKTTNVIIGGWKDGKFSAAGNASYSGLISLTKEQQIELFEKQKIRLTQSTILQREKITNYSIEYPFSVKTPNTVMQNWLSIPLTKIVWPFIPFRFYPEERQSALKLFEGLIQQCTKIKEAQDKPIKMPPSPLVTVKKELFYKWQSFNLDDLCITDEELNKAKQFWDGKNVEISPLSDRCLVGKKTKSKRSDDLADFLIEIMTAFPDYTAKEYWRLIEQTASEPEDTREFDRHNVIMSISADGLLEWRDRKGQPRKSIGFDTLSNRISRLKKQVFQNENS